MVKYHFLLVVEATTTIGHSFGKVRYLAELQCGGKGESRLCFHSHICLPAIILASCRSGVSRPCFSNVRLTVIETKDRFTRHYLGEPPQ